MTLGGSNSAFDEVMLKIRSGPQPLLLMVNSSSANEPTQTFPKLPASAMAVATEPHGLTRISHAPRPKVPAASSNCPARISPCTSLILVFGSPWTHLVQVAPRSKDR